MTLPARRVDDAPARALAAYQPVTAVVDEEAQRWRMLVEQATLVGNVPDLLPKAYRAGSQQHVTARLVVAGLAGQPFGWNLLTSVRLIDVIDGQPKLKAEAQAGLIRQAGHKLVIDADAERATVTGVRADDGSKYTATWDVARAEATPHTEWTGYKDNRQKVDSTLLRKWKANGNVSYMLLWRAISEVARFLFSDLTLGLAFASGERPDDDMVELDPPAVEAASSEMAKQEVVAADLGPVVVLDGPEPESPMEPADDERAQPNWWMDQLRASDVQLGSLRERWPRLTGYLQLARASRERQDEVLTYLRELREGTDG